MGELGVADDPELPRAHMKGPNGEMVEVADGHVRLKTGGSSIVDLDENEVSIDGMTVALQGTAMVSIEGAGKVDVNGPVVSINKDALTVI
jgi:hypothetical protein